ncbi:unnamed protein product [Prorocentrum cordatum]|uniref:Uncharacterized protein n=1 Tax=Prorocentrum cordatum TaxID=2364126 RepID=A0ABN9TJ40_9DINO|nr:unnamed protein product [Polarella glacialis]
MSATLVESALAAPAPASPAASEAPTLSADVGDAAESTGAASVSDGAAAACSDGKELTVLCSCCRQHKPASEVYTQAANELAGSKCTARCRKCNSLKERIRRVVKGGHVTDQALADLDPDSRADLFARGADLFSDDLKKLLTEKVTNTTVSKAAHRMKAVGGFVRTAELKAKILAQPGGEARWAMYELNGTTIRHDVTGEELMWNPEYSMELSKSEESELEKKRKTENAAKASAATPTDQEADADNKVRVESAPKSLSAGLIKRIAAAIPKLEDDVLQLSAVLLQVTAPENVDNFAPKKVKDATKVKNDLAASIVTLQGLVDTNTGNSKDINVFLKSVNGMKASAKAASAEFKKSIDAMQAEAEAEVVEE